MALDSYANLQKTVLDWLARPDDPLVAPAVPDMIQMFEEEARDRLQSRFGEKNAIVYSLPGSPTVIPLPLDYGELRTLWVSTPSGPRFLTYQTPNNMGHLQYSVGDLEAFTIVGLNLVVKGETIGPSDPVNLNYLSGLPPLSTTIITNWLLDQYPSAYLMGTLSYAAPYIGDDPRLQVWLAAREATFERIRLADRRAKYPHTLMIQTDVRNP